MTSKIPQTKRFSTEKQKRESGRHWCVLAGATTKTSAGNPTRRLNRYPEFGQALRERSNTACFLPVSNPKPALF